MKIVIPIILLVSVFIHIQCSTSNREQEGILTADKMSSIIADMQLVETFSVIPSSLQPFVRDSLDFYYQGVLNAHQTTHQQFYASLEFYSFYPDQLEAIYRNSILLLEKELELYANVDENSQETIMAFSMQQVLLVLAETPFKDWLLSDEEINIGEFRDSVFQFIELNDSIILQQGINLSSFKYSYAINATQPVLFNQMREQLKMHVKTLK
jgi:hypothetical protein